MTQHAPNHPDPVTSPQFYSSVPMKRFFAWIIDTVITAILTVVAVPFTGFTALFFLSLLFFVVGFGYRCITIGSGSATLGMRMMSIELRDARGERFDFSQAVVHTLGFTISSMFFLLQVLSAIMMLGTARGQGLTDMALGSVMINRK